MCPIYSEYNICDDGDCWLWLFGKCLTNLRTMLYIYTPRNHSARIMPSPKHLAFVYVRRYTCSKGEDKIKLRKPESVMVKVKASRRFYVHR